MKTALRTLKVFEAYSTLQRPLTLSELARELQAPRSSCFELLRTLEARGYLYQVGAERRYYPTRQMAAHARAIEAHDPVLQKLEPALTGLRDATGETVILGKRQGDGVVYLDLHEGLHTIRYQERIGAAKPLHCSAIGKALLGSLEPPECRALLRRLPLRRITGRTLTTRKALLADLAKGRRKGLFITRGENVADVMAVAAVVRSGGEALGIALAGPWPRMEANLAAYGEALRNTCAAVEGA